MYLRKIAHKSLAQDVVKGADTTMIEELLTQLVEDIKGMNFWLEIISGDIAIQGGMLAKLQMDQGCRVCQKDIEHGLVNVEGEDDIQKSQCRVTR